MSGRGVVHIGIIVVSLIVAAGLFKLAHQYQPDGVLGWLQDRLQVLFVLPYLTGIVFGGTAHSPNAAGVFLGFLIEVYAIAIVGWWVIRMLRPKPASGTR